MKRTHRTLYLCDNARSAKFSTCRASERIPLSRSIARVIWCDWGIFYVKLHSDI